MATVWTLVSTPGSVQSLAVRIAAAVAGIELKLDDKATSGIKTFPALRTPEGVLTRSGAILRYIAGTAPPAELYGRSDIEEGFVDSWLEWGAEELIVVGAVAVLQPAVPGAVGRLLANLDILSKHLEARTFVAGERLTIADISIATTLWDLVRSSPSLDVFKGRPHLQRWYETCIHQKAFETVLGGAGAVAAARGPARASATGGGGGGGGAGDSVRVSERVEVSVVGEKATVIPELFTRRRTLICGISEASIGKEVTVAGWCRTSRVQAERAFIELSDGSGAGSLQLVCEPGKTDGWDALVAAGGSAGTGASLEAHGTIVKSMGKGQVVELQASSIKVIGTVDPRVYPIAKKTHTLEHLRDFMHLRMRTNTIAAVTRVRNACAFATHKFYRERGFLYIHTPIITGADCEGAGEMFGVTTLLPKDPKKDLPRTKDRSIDYKQDFFATQTSLTVSGQLQVECFACSMGDVYTFGPTFRAENSHTSRHLAEFWMIEPEIAFATLEDDMALAEDYLKYCTQYVLDNCDSDLAFFEKHFEEGLRARLQNVISHRFERCTYTRAIDILQDAVKSGHKFKDAPPAWGGDLASEHERYIVEVVFKKPTIVTNYPKGIKAFYMKLDEDGRTVRAMDVLVPKIGEIIGGSQREERLEVLEKRMEEMHIERDQLQWYLDLRRYGTVPHAGFGLGFERLVMYVSGIENIRDVIPFPRWPGHADV